MNIRQEAEYAISLASILKKMASRKIETPDSITLSESDRYYVTLRYNLEAFGKLTKEFYLDTYVEEVNNDDGKNNEYERLIYNYFKFVSFVFEELIQDEGIISNALIDEILAEAENIRPETIYKNENGKARNNLINIYMPRMLKLKGMVKDEILNKKISNPNGFYIKSLRDEIRKMNETVEREISFLSKKHNESSSELRGITDHYGKNINKLISDANEDISRYNQYITTVKDDIDNKVVRLDALMTEADKKRIIGEQFLQASSQNGMAGAFQNRGLELEKPMKIWMFAFFICLVILVVAGGLLLFYAFTNDNASLSEILSKLAVTFPVVWCAWFSAKQYSHISQLREDYAYKVAVAMSYHGYKNEATNGIDTANGNEVNNGSEVTNKNNEMSNKLLENIIGQFSDNPVRLYQNKNDASVVEALIKNDKLSEVLNSIKTK